MHSNDDSDAAAADHGCGYDSDDDDDGDDDDDNDDDGDGDDNGDGDDDDGDHGDVFCDDRGMETSDRQGPGRQSCSKDEAAILWWYVQGPVSCRATDCSSCDDSSPDY